MNSITIKKMDLSLKLALVTVLASGEGKVSRYHLKDGEKPISGPVPWATEKTTGWHLSQKDGNRFSAPIFISEGMAIPHPDEDGCFTIPYTGTRYALRKETLKELFAAAKAFPKGFNPYY